MFYDSLVSSPVYPLLVSSIVLSWMLEKLYREEATQQLVLRMKSIKHLRAGYRRTMCIPEEFIKSTVGGERVVRDKILRELAFPVLHFWTPQSDDIYRSDRRLFYFRPFLRRELHVTIAKIWINIRMKYVTGER